MKFAVESWSPDYGASLDDERLPSASTVDAAVEIPVEQWAPRSPAPSASPIEDLVFVDGVRRVEAHVWITDDGGDMYPGMCASYAAGAVHCNGRARIVAPRVERIFLSPYPDAGAIRTRHAEFPARSADEGVDLSLLLQHHMARLETHVASEAGPTALVVVDGPLRGGHTSGDRVDAPAFVGYVKTHRMAYGPPVVGEVISQLGAGQRTPLLRVGDTHQHFTWYQRLPTQARHGWAGVVRLETPAADGVERVTTLADRLCRTLGHFASCEQKDPRAPQNLYPVGALERELRRRLGDPALIHRALRAAATV